MVCNSSLTHWFWWGHDDVIKWKYFPCNWPFVRGIHRLPVNSPHKDQWRGALMFALIWGWINGWVNKREAGDLRRHRAHPYVIVMVIRCLSCPIFLMNVPDAFIVKEVWQHHHPPHCFNGWPFKCILLQDLSMWFAISWNLMICQKVYIKLTYEESFPKAGT